MVLFLLYFSFSQRHKTLHKQNNTILEHDTVTMWGRGTENYHSTNTVFLVGTLMSVVGGVFITFALMALCYRSVVVHKNFSLCLRLVYSVPQVDVNVRFFRISVRLIHISTNTLTFWIKISVFQESLVITF